MPASKQTTEPGCEADAAPAKVLGADEEVPELPSLPEAEANNVQSDAVAPLLTVMFTGELVAETPARSVVFAVSVCEPLGSEALLRL